MICLVTAIGLTHGGSSIIQYTFTHKHPVAVAVAYPGIFFRGGWGGSTNSVEDRGERERGSGGSCNLVQEISFHMVKFS